MIDTDTALVGQLANQTAISPALAVDTVRIDVVGSDREIKDYREFTAPELLDWPLSLGVTTTTTSAVRLRIRAFRASLATKGTLASAATLEPPTNLLIDRLVEIPEPPDSVKAVRIVLAAACFGAPVSFQQPLTTCISRDRREGSPSEGVLDGSTSAATIAGTAAEAHEVPCQPSSPARADAICIPGGPSILGDPHLAGVIDGPTTAPLRPILLSPFQMDKTEFTVGRYRDLVNRHLLTDVPVTRDPADTELNIFCTWLGADKAGTDALPVNCISYDSALKACTAAGGTLPTEAQWEHAARGRGRSFNYPWGNDEPSCCSASISRASSFLLNQCKGSDLEPVASHIAGTGCSPIDVTPDGVIDLGGSVSEMTLDGGMAYSDRCWTGPGLLLDPHCQDPNINVGVSIRGADWESGTFLLHSAIRPPHTTLINTVGFRCVYRDGT